MGHKPGDIVWRGYARTYGNGTIYYPEIRPGQIVQVDKDGLLTVNLEGVIPGREGSRSPGQWRAWNQNPAGYFETPEEALAHAKEVVMEVLSLDQNKLQDEMDKQEQQEGS